MPAQHAYYVPNSAYSIHVLPAEGSTAPATSAGLGATSGYNGGMGVPASGASVLNSAPPVPSAAAAAAYAAGRAAYAMDVGVGNVPGANNGRVAGAATPGLSSRVTPYNPPGMGQAERRQETGKSSRVDAGSHQYQHEDKKEPRPPPSHPPPPPGASPGWLSKSRFTLIFYHVFVELFKHI